MGHRTFDLAGDPDSYAVDYEYQVPLFVLTHRASEREPARNEDLYVRFVLQWPVFCVSGRFTS